MSDEHVCNQGKKFDAINESVGEVKRDLDEHRKIQQEQDREREKHRITQQAHDKAIDTKLNEISAQITSLIELNTDVNNIKIAWKVGKSVGYNITKFIIAVTVILGAIWALRDFFTRK
jgi:DNA repair exonuclease SbcCD ATPase subunit